MSAAAIVSSKRILMVMLAIVGVSVGVIVIAGLILIVIVSLAGDMAHGQGYPTRAVRLIVPLAAGGPADTTARLYATALADRLGQNVLVENRAGASGVVGTEAVVRSAADGYTLLFGSSSSFAVNPAVMKNLRFDVRRDLKLIGLVSQTDFVLVVKSTGTELKSLADVVRIAKAAPGKLSYGSSGTGGIIHLTHELFHLEAGLSLVHIPFRGGGPALIGVLSGDADMAFIDVSTILPHVRSGKLAALAIASTMRAAQLPDVPTVIELGFPRVETKSWYGLAAPAGLSADAIAKLETATNAIAASPTFQAGLEKVGLQPLTMTPAETAAFIERDLDKWARVAKAAKIEIEN